MSSGPAGGVPPASGAARPVAPALVEVLGVAARRLRARLSSRAGRDIPVRVGAPRIATLAEIVADGPPDAGLWCLYPRAEADASDAPALVVVDEDLLPALVGSLFGAGADDGPLLAGERRRGRGASEVERAVGTRMCRELVESIVDAWAGGPAPRLVAGETACSPRVCEDLDPDARYVIARLDVGPARERLGTLDVALPAALVPGVQPAARPPRLQTVESPPRYERLLPIELELVAELGRMHLPVGQLRALAVGDEIPLRLTTETVGRVGDRAAVTGEAGSRAGVRSLRVTGRANSTSSPGAADR